MPSMTNPQSDRVRKIRHLVTPAGRRRSGQFLVEGPQGVREVVRHAPVRVVDVYLTVEASTRHVDILDEATRSKLYVHLCSPEVLQEMSPDAQGILAVVRGDSGAEPDYAGARFLAGLVEVRDPGNLGTIIRAADAAGASGVVLSSGSVDVENPKVVRSTAGSMFHLPVTTGGTAEEMVARARAAGMQVLATSATGEHNLEDLTTGRGVLTLMIPTLWLFGNESHGLDPAHVAAADATVSIPVYGHAESLNLAMAATLCLYASARAQA